MQFIRKSKTLLLILLITTLAACGSSDSDSGADSPDNDPNAQVYNGTATINLTTNVAGVGPETDTGPIRVTDSNGTITVSSSGESGSANRDGNAYSVPVRLNVSDSGVTCVGDIIFNGTINGNTTSGSITGSIPCSGVVSGTVTANGEFTATK